MADTPTRAEVEALARRAERYARNEDATWRDAGEFGREHNVASEWRLVAKHLRARAALRKANEALGEKA